MSERTRRRRNMRRGSGDPRGERPERFNDRSIRRSYGAEIGEIENQRTFYRERSDTDRARISTDYEAAGDELEGRQEKQFAGRATGLVTSGGGFLGATQSQEGVLQNLTAEHEGDTLALYQKRDSAIESARNAYLEKDFQLSREKTTLARQMESAITDAKDRFASRKIAMSTEARNQSKFEQEWATNSLEQWALGAAPVNSRDMRRAAKAFGTTTEGVNKLLEATKASANAKGYKAKLENLKLIADLSSSYPAGSKIPMPDGSFITAVGSSGDWNISEHTDRYGNVVMVRTNKLTGSQTTKNLGRIGKPSAESGGSSGSGGSGGFKIGNAGTGQLLNLGFSTENESGQNEIQLLERDLNRYGLKFTLRNLKLQSRTDENLARNYAAIEKFLQTLVTGGQSGSRSQYRATATDPYDDE